MALYTIADLHLACAVDKPMDIFGGKWQNYMEKIKKHWNAIITPEDTVVIGGDLSWDISFAQSKADFDYLHALPGRTPAQGQPRSVVEHDQEDDRVLHAERLR